MDDGVVADDESHDGAYRQGDLELGTLDAWGSGPEGGREEFAGDDGGKDVGVKEGEGEEHDVGPDVEHLGEMDGCDVVFFVA